MERMPILYDADCRFCRASVAAVLVWDRRGRLRPVALQSKEAEQLLPGLGADERMSAAYLAPPGRAPVSGGAIAAALLPELPGGSGPAWIANRVPGLAHRTYAWVAHNRGRLSRLVPGPIARRADSLVAERNAERAIPSPLGLR